MRVQSLSKRSGAAQRILQDKPISNRLLYALRYRHGQGPAVSV
jgi:hypothetical protein